MKPQAEPPSRARWQAAARARPLLWWPDDMLHALGEACDRAMGDWAQAWGVPAQAMRRCAVKDASSGSRGAGDDHAAADDGPWLPLGAIDRPDAPAHAWISRPAEWESRVAAALFAGTREVRGMAASIASLAARDAIGRLAALFELEPQALTGAALPASVDRPWSGALRVQLPPAPGGLLVLDGAAVLAWQRHLPKFPRASRAARAPAALHAVNELVAHHPTRVRARLLDVELSLGRLQSLRVGDLVRLPHRLEAPATVTDLDGRPLFAAYLGRRGLRKALELVPMPQTTHPALPETSPT